MSTKSKAGMSRAAHPCTRSGLFLIQINGDAVHAEPGAIVLAGNMAQVTIAASLNLRCTIVVHYAPERLGVDDEDASSAIFLHCVRE